ncbi:AAA family ATPase, partial [uncultured Thomasclavelia sp.]|uniref:AAA family ATPase n=1 Tax=uncultured Thomasclavelia sp. TaxID=3025759 RepID=UPI00262EC0B4
MKRISTGIENFKELLDNNYYYVDKTRLIEDILSDKVMLYTRPERFGKTLNLSMLYYFFSNKEKENSYLFERLNISKDKEILKHQNQYPVIFLTLKDMNNNNFQSQIYIFANLIANIIDIYTEIKNSDTISQRERKLLDIYQNAEADIDDLKISLKILSHCLYKHYQQKVIILIDEYDVPLQSAYNNGYYDEMVDFLRSVFSSALKTNDALERGVLTGCLRIAKESIFTGLNNFTVRSITSQYACDCFGFTQEEIDNLLDY